VAGQRSIKIWSEKWDTNIRVFHVFQSFCLFCALNVHNGFVIQCYKCLFRLSLRPNVKLGQSGVPDISLELRLGPPKVCDGSTLLYNSDIAYYGLRRVRLYVGAGACVSGAE